MDRTALIFGATGAVGKQLLLDVLKNGSYARVVSVGRRQVELDDSVPQDKLEQKVIDFENLEAHREAFKNVSAEKFVKIDQTYVLNSAKLIAEENKPAGADLAPVHFLYCSSTNANKNSFLLYPKTKGETEAALEETGFEKVSIFRPAFLETVEPRTRPRTMESIAFTIVNPINRLLNAGLVINVATVAKAMHKVAEDATIKPTSPEKNVRKSVIGSLVSAFSNADIENTVF
ncbi:hypothetical protein BDF20DRAFT_907093 [Mycotypha africana]|uniref:uncharacterized protein n=1 Tax=Mycotypha africana TaxID=64632 RepID=UPI00230055D8|nr:uncharacterized protein BDF20DRAFT_907093 [Mycotypha africana]KAI8973563.1 hypothetical protein BDF20DRAFT_907093 [Mycotypha africana]